MIPTLSFTKSRLAVTGLVIALSAAMAPTSALAADVRTESSVSVGPSESVNDDLYAFGQNVDVRGQINGDVVAGGSNTVVSGVVNGDVLVAAGTTTINGDVHGTVRAAGGTVIINGPVDKDLLVAGGSVETGPNARIGRDVLVGSGSISIAGPIGRNLKASGGDLTLKAPIGGSVDATVDTLKVNSGTSIGGGLRYTSSRDAQIASDATVRGGVQHVLPPQPSAGPQPVPVLGGTIGWLRALVGLFALGLILVLPLPGFSRRTSDALWNSTWASLGIGAAVLVVTPVAALAVAILGAILGGWWLSLAVLAVYGISLVLGYVVAAFWTGKTLLDRTIPQAVHRVWALLLGLAVLTLASRIPYVGGWISFVALVFGLGALLVAVGQAYRRPGGRVGEALAAAPAPGEDAATMRAPVSVA